MSFTDESAADRFPKYSTIISGRLLFVSSVSMGKLVNPFASHAKDPRFEPEWRHLLHFCCVLLLFEKLQFSFGVCFCSFCLPFRQLILSRLSDSSTCDNYILIMIIAFYFHSWRNNVVIAFEAIVKIECHLFSLISSDSDMSQSVGTRHLKSPGPEASK